MSDGTGTHVSWLRELIGRRVRIEAGATEQAVGRLLAARDDHLIVDDPQTGPAYYPLTRVKTVAVDARDGSPEEKAVRPQPVGGPDEAETDDLRGVLAGLQYRWVQIKLDRPGTTLQGVLVRASADQLLLVRDREIVWVNPAHMIRIALGTEKNGTKPAPRAGSDHSDKLSNESSSNESSPDAAAVGSDAPRAALLQASAHSEIAAVPDDLDGQDSNDNTQLISGSSNYSPNYSPSYKSTVSTVSNPDDSQSSVVVHHHNSHTVNSGNFNSGNNSGTLAIGNAECSDKGGGSGSGQHRSSGSHNRSTGSGAAKGSTQRSAIPNHDPEAKESGPNERAPRPHAIDHDRKKRKRKSARGARRTRPFAITFSAHSHQSRSKRRKASRLRPGRKRGVGRQTLRLAIRPRALQRPLLRPAYFPAPSGAGANQRAKRFRGVKAGRPARRRAARLPSGVQTARSRQRRAHP
jgi:hypothetical protein